VAATAKVGHPARLPTCRKTGSHTGDGIIKKPEEEIQELISKQPAWVRAIVQPPKPVDPHLTQIFGLPSNASTAPVAGFQFPSAQMRGFMHAVARIIGPIPKAQRKRLAGLLEEWVLDAVPGRAGRPRIDDLAEEALRLKCQGKSYGQIAKRLRKSRESVRKLIKSRQRPPEKTPS